MIWRPIDFDAPAVSKVNERPMAYVRFARDVPRSDALRLATEAARAADSSNAGLRPWVEPLAGLVLDAYSQRAVPLLAGGVVLVFLVLCANVSSLLLARLTARQREFSLRSALGASRGRLIRQAFVEAAVLGAIGVVVGVSVGWLLVSVSRALLPEAFLLRTLNPLNIDVRALTVTSVASIAATLGASVLPAFIGTRVNAGESLRVIERGGTETRAARAATRGLLIAEIALACTLLVGATLLVRSFINLAGADRGLDATGVLTATMSLPRQEFPDRVARAAAAQLLEAQVRQLPGIHQVAWSVRPSSERRRHFIWSLAIRCPWCARPGHGCRTIQRRPGVLCALRDTPRSRPRVRAVRLRERGGRRRPTRCRPLARARPGRPQLQLRKGTLSRHRSR